MPETKQLRIDKIMVATPWKNKTKPKRVIKKAQPKQARLDKIWKNEQKTEQEEDLL